MVILTMRSEGNAMQIWTGRLRSKAARLMPASHLFAAPYLQAAMCGTSSILWTSASYTSRSSLQPVREGTALHEGDSGGVSTQQCPQDRPNKTKVDEMGNNGVARTSF